MLFPNNPDLDVTELSKRAAKIAASRRRSTPLFKNAALGSATPSPVYERRVPVATRIKARIKTIPFIGTFAVKVNRRIHYIARPGLHVKERVRLIPVLGSLAFWLYGIVRLNTVRQKLALELAELRHMQGVANSRLDQFDRTDIANRLNRYDSLDLESRLARLDSLDLANRLAEFDDLDIQIRLQRLESAERTRRLAQLNAVEMKNRLAELETLPDMLQKMQREISHQYNQVAALTQELRRTVETTVNQAQATHTLPAIGDSVDAVVVPSQFDNFYVEFERKFRGSREDIRDRLKVYLPYLESFIGDPTARIVDVGCGRGEWLGLLKDSGITAVGIDLNQSMVSECQDRGLTAYYADAVDYLRQQPAESLSAVTGFHIIEHLPFEVQINLFDEALRALKNDGMVIFETPNPENLYVGSCSFYTDPTHLHPVVPSVAEFMAGQRGFARVELLRLHPFPTELQLTEETDVARRFNSMVYSAQDYAVIAWKSHAD